jgi:hypothetical protein
MSVLNELALGYLLGVFGIIVLFAPALIRTLDPVAPDACMGLWPGRAHESVEVRRTRRLPLKKRFTFFPDRGLIGGAVILLLLVPVFFMVTQHELSKGIYVRFGPSTPTRT